MKHIQKTFFVSTTLLLFCLSSAFSQGERIDEKIQVSFEYGGKWAKKGFASKAIATYRSKPIMESTLKKEFISDCGLRQIKVYQVQYNGQGEIIFRGNLLYEWDERKQCYSFFKAETITGIREFSFFGEWPYYPPEVSQTEDN